MQTVCSACHTHRARLFAAVLRQVNSCQRRHRRGRLVIDPKRLQSSVEKFMVRNEKLQNKLYDNEEDITRPDTPLLSFEKGNKKKLTQNIVVRERNVSNLIKNEVQNVLSSGLAGEEFPGLEITLTKAVMSSANSCRIFWEPHFSAKDVEISDALNGASKNIRHILMASHVMNNVPNLHFHLDPDAMTYAEVDKIFKEQNLDMGPPEEQREMPETEPTETHVGKLDLFGLEYDSLYENLKQLKRSNKVDKG